MQLKISQPLTIFELGQRDNQEDSLFPEIGNCTPQTRTFVVCDGMGGHEKGEVASQAVCNAFKRNADKLSDFSAETLSHVINDAYEALDEADDNSSKRKMGTTLAMLHLNNNGATIAHIGDSRVYFISPSRQFIWHTRDHSLVQSFVEANLIKEEEMKTHPQRNILTRAMQPHSDRPEATINTISDIVAGDYFMLCSDGIIEDFDDDVMLKLFSDKTLSDTQKRDEIIKMTKYNSDNHTAYIIPIEEVIEDNSSCSDFQSSNPVFEIMPPVKINSSAEDLTPTRSQTERKSGTMKSAIIALAIFLITIGIVYLIIKQFLN